MGPHCTMYYITNSKIYLKVGLCEVRLGGVGVSGWVGLEGQFKHTYKMNRFVE